MSKHVALKALVVMLGVVAMSLIATSSAIAQENPAGAALNQHLYFDLDFPGGTLEQYLDAIRKAHPSANIIASDLSDEMKTARVPAMKLKDVTLGAVIELVQGPTHNAADLSVNISYIPVKIAGRMERAYRVSAYAPMRIMEAMGKQNEKIAAQQIMEGKSNVWSLRGLVDAGMKMDDVLGAVRVALKTIDKPSQIRLHEPTSLLIVRGTKEQLELVDQAVSAMIEDMNKRADQEKDDLLQMNAMQEQLVKAAEKSRAESENKANMTALQLDNLQGELVKAEVERRFTQKKFEIASERAKAYQQDFENRRPGLPEDARSNSEDIIRSYELDVIVAEGKLEIARDSVDRLIKRIERLQGNGSE